MYEFSEPLYPQLFETPFYEIFHSLYIVVGGLLYLFYSHSIFNRKFTIDISQFFKIFAVERFQLFKGYFAECYEILYFNSYSIFYKGIFREIVFQLFYFVVISAIYRRNGGKCVVEHDCFYN